MQVLLGMNRAPATRFLLPDAKGEVQVQAGAVKMRVSTDHAAASAPAEGEKKTVVRASTGASQRSAKWNVT